MSHTAHAAIYGRGGAFDVAQEITIMINGKSVWCNGRKFARMFSRL